MSALSERAQVGSARLLGLLVLGAAIGGCYTEASGGHASRATATPMSMPLTLTASTTRPSFPLGSPVTVRVTLRNRSQAPVWLNRRMAVGYEDGLEREIYFTVLAADGSRLPVPDEERVDVHRMAPGPADFARFDPDASADTTVDLAHFHPFRRAGSYRIVFTYENRHGGGEYGVRAFVGSITAEPITVVVE